MTYQIEENIPFPRAGRGRQPSEETVTFRKMKHGQSFVIRLDDLPEESRKHKIAVLHQAARRDGVRCVSRKLEDGTYRVWKIEV